MAIASLKNNLKIGIAIETTTDITLLESFIPYIQFIQCMGIEHPGVQGSKTDERVFDQVRRLKEQYPNMPLSVDGSVGFEDIDQLLTLGVENLVIGSAIFKTENPEETYLDFNDIAQEYE